MRPFPIVVLFASLFLHTGFAAERDFVTPDFAVQRQEDGSRSLLLLDREGRELGARDLGRAAVHPGPGVVALLHPGSGGERDVEVIAAGGATRGRFAMPIGVRVVPGAETVVLHEDAVHQPAVAWRLEFRAHDGGSLGVLSRPDATLGRVQPIAGAGFVAFGAESGGDVRVEFIGSSGVGLWSRSIAANALPIVDVAPSGAALLATAAADLQSARLSVLDSGGAEIATHGFLPVQQVVFSPRGDLGAGVGRAGVIVVDLQSGDERTRSVTDRALLPGRSAAFSPDGSRLFLMAAAGFHARERSTAILHVLHDSGHPLAERIVQLPGIVVDPASRVVGLVPLEDGRLRIVLDHAQFIVVP